MSGALKSVLREVLCCPLCGKLPALPAAVCREGHAVCRSCLLEEGSCPCGESCTPGRHTLLNSLLDALSTESLRSLPDLLECPVCYEQIDEAASVCRNGHAVCGSCHCLTARCPVCRGDFAPTFNWALNRVVRTLERPVRCANSASGCPYEDLYTSVALHEDSCVFRSLRCLVCKEWEGAAGVLYDHVAERHSSSLLGTARVRLRERRSEVYLVRAGRGDHHFWVRARSEPGLGLRLGVQAAHRDPALSSRYKANLRLSTSHTILSYWFSLYDHTADLDQAVEKGACVVVPSSVVDKLRGRPPLASTTETHGFWVSLVKVPLGGPSLHTLFAALFLNTLHFCWKIGGR